MPGVRLRTVDVPAENRFPLWRDVITESHVPMSIESDHRDDFRASVELHDLGLMQISRLTYPALRARRTERMIRQSDPEMLLVSHLPRGSMVKQIGRDEVTNDRSSVLVHDTSRPATVVNEARVTNIVLQLPRSALDRNGNLAERIVASPIPTSHGIGAVLAFVLRDLAKYAAIHPPAVITQLTATVLDLLTAAARSSTAPRIVLPGARSRIRQTQIHGYIRRRLADPALSPTTVAEAHGLSIRQLHRVFEADGATPSAWIRRQRLEQCRRELADPELADRPVVAIGARWGFPDPVTFNRAFRREFGLPPGEYRRRYMGLELVGPLGF